MMKKIQKLTKNNENAPELRNIYLKILKIQNGPERKKSGTNARTDAVRPLLICK